MSFFSWFTKGIILKSPPILLTEKQKHDKLVASFTSDPRYIAGTHTWCWDCKKLISKESSCDYGWNGECSVSGFDIKISAEWPPVSSRNDW